jgi:hypothetical protein
MQGEQEVSRFALLKSLLFFAVVVELCNLDLVR